MNTHDLPLAAVTGFPEGPSTPNNLGSLWDAITSAQAAAPLWVVLGTAALAVMTVAVTPAWRVARNVVTIAHEGGHAVAALVTRRRLAGIKLHSDTSGVTVSAGRPDGPGMVVTAAAGYIAPSLMGLAAAWVLAAGYPQAMLWGTLVMLAGMLVQIRNFYGAFTVLATGAAVFAVTWWTPVTVQSGFAYLMAWFLLVSGTKPVVELQRKRRTGEAAESDADQLAALTGIPGIAWVGFFGAVTLACAALGGFWLLF